MKVGLIGLGEVAQLMHLPVLFDMRDKFEIYGAFDVSNSLLNAIAEKYSIKKTYESAEHLIKDADIDVVFVLSPDQYHKEHIELAIKNGKHVFVEKPVTLLRADLESLIEIEKLHKEKTVMVGYMRRFASNFLKAKEIMAEKPVQTEYLRFRDIICEGPFYIGQTRPVFYPNDIKKSVFEQGATKKGEQLSEIFGNSCSEGKLKSYTMLTGLGSHSFSAVRELFGMPRKIVSAVSAKNGEQLTVILEYDGFMGVYELVNNQDVVQFDAAIEIFQRNRKLLIKQETSYVRNQPSTLEVTESGEKETVTKTYGPDLRDPFKNELEYFYDCIVNRKRPKTDLADSLDDLKLFEEIVAKIEEL